MKKMVYCVLRHIAKFFAGYTIGLFLLIAAMTCGAMRCTDANMVMQVTLAAALRIAVTETVLLLGLVLASMHPFGCAISVAVIGIKGYQYGLTLGWWSAQTLQQPLWLVPLGIQGAISVTAALVACCVTAYAALRVRFLTRREYLRHIVVIWVVLMGCVILRCMICARIL